MCHFLMALLDLVPVVDVHETVALVDVIDGMLTSGPRAGPNPQANDATG
jgi:hypothetical protein